jgi:outer membrane protein assembly factor BamA
MSQSVKGDSLFELRLGRIPHEPGRAPSRRPGFEWMPGFVAGEQGERFYIYGQAKLLDLGAGRYLQGYSDPLRQESFDAVAGYRLSPNLAFQVQAGLLSVSPGEEARTLGMEFAPAVDAPGLAWHRDYARLTSELAWEGRVRPRHPRGGQFASLRLEHYRGLGAVPGFSRVGLDVRHFQPLGSERHILALRGAVSLAHTNGVAVPYYLQDSLGGGSTLRSYPEHRFSGDRLIAFSAEYRFQALRWLELAGFYDGGRAWGGLSALGSEGFRSSTGLGLRLTTPTRVLLRFDVARGDEGTRLNVRVGHSF